MYVIKDKFFGGMLLIATAIYCEQLAENSVSNQNWIIADIQFLIGVVFLFLGIYVVAMGPKRTLSATEKLARWNSRWRQAKKLHERGQKRIQQGFADINQAKSIIEKINYDS